MSLFFYYIPEYISNLLIKLFYNIIYFVSYGEILFVQNVQNPVTKFWNTIYPPMDEHEVNEVYSKDTKTCENIKTSLLINPLLKIRRFKKYNSAEKQYDLWDMVCPINICLDLPLNTVPLKRSNVRFLDIELNFTSKNKENIEHSILLSTPTYNYYVVGNKFCSTFIDYFMHTYHKDFINKHDLQVPFNYTLNIVDHNINIINLTENNAIVLNENDYTVLVLETD